MLAEPDAELYGLLLAAEKVRPKIESALLAHPIFTQPHFRLSSRVKSIQRAHNKLSRIRITKPNTVVTELPDIIGFRIVTLFNESVIQGLDAILDTIQHKGEIGNISPFNRDRVEIIVYSARPESDPLSFKRAVEEWLSRRVIGITDYKPYSPDTLYSSVHVITECMVMVERIDGSSSQVSIPVEIQFRTALEDVWGQISHLTAYTFPDRSTLVGKHLNALKQLIDGCALYADIIKVDADIATAAAREAKEEPKSASESASEGLRNVPGDIAAAFGAALSQRKTASSIEQSLARFEFLEASKKFATIEERIRYVEGLSDIDRAEGIYRARMERAFCLMHADDIASKDEAFSLYQLLAKADPTDAVCRFRLGQSLRKRDKFVEARDMLLDAKNLLEVGGDHRVGPRSWIRGAISVELGNAYWVIFSGLKDIAERHEAIKDAILETKLGLERFQTTGADEQEILGAVNNILYFSWEEIVNFGTCILGQEELENFLDQLSTERVIALFPAFKHDAVLDTALRMSRYLERHASIESIALAVMDTVREKVKRRSNQVKIPELATFQKNLTTDEFDTYWYAMETIAYLSLGAK